MCQIQYYLLNKRFHNMTYVFNSGFRLVGKLALAGTDKKIIWKNIKEIRKVDLENQCNSFIA